MKKMLYVASTFIHLKHFHLDYLGYFTRQGWEVQVLASGDPDLVPGVYRKIVLPFEKKMSSPKNFSTALKIARLIRQERYDAIQVHTSLAAFFTRLGIQLSGYRPQLVSNTVHGYLFDDQSPALKRIVMLGAEKWMKPVTDLLMVMNQEDLEIARNNRLSRGRVIQIHGMGLELSRFPERREEESARLRQEAGIVPEELVLLYPAEFSKRKNQIFLLEGVRKLREDGVPLRLILPGEGGLLEECREQARQWGLEGQVEFPGYTRELPRYLQMADLAVSSSRIEGLPFNLMEAMAAGLPLAATRIKGHTDLIEQGRNGFLFDFGDLDGFCTAVRHLYEDPGLRRRMGRENRERIQAYSLEQVLPEVVAAWEEAWHEKEGVGC